MEQLKDLNPEQRKAVTTTEGPLLILAGAGSGKTRVLTYRYTYLVEEKGIGLDRILAITFTNKAAEEMKERISRMLSIHPRHTWISTFHSACVRILRIHGENIRIRRSFTIADSADQAALIRKCIKDLNYDDKDYPVQAVLAQISQVKNRLQEIDDFVNEAGGYREQRMGRIMQRYQKYLRENDTLDFDDLLVQTVKLLRTFPSVLKEYQDQFQYIMVDEYQDTNYAQYVLVNLLAAEHRNICVVGDDNQSIYRWRGADITNILNFESDYPEAVVIKLEQNYRSTKTILDAANHLVKNNYQQKEKNLWTDNEVGEKIVCRRLSDEHEEADFVANEMVTLMKNSNYRFSSFAVLYRMNAQSRVLEEALMHRKIPYTIVGGTKFYQRKEIKDIIAYLRLIQNPGDTMSLERIINVPRRGIGDATLERVRGYCLDHKMDLAVGIRECERIQGLSAKVRGELKKLAELLWDLNQRRDETPVADMIDEIVEKTGYVRLLEKEDTPESLSKIENMKEFYGVAKEFQANEPDLTLEDFLASIALISEVDTLSDGDAVVLMTLHSAKGLEFPIVFLTGMEEGIFPHSRSIDSEEELEEERRLCYVGITRAEKKLYMTYTARRSVFGQTSICLPSRFLDELPEELLEQNVVRQTPFIKKAAFTKDDPSFSKNQTIREEAQRAIKSPDSTDFGLGEKIVHKTFGIGTIIGKKEITDDIELTISFQKGGIKKLSAKYAPIQNMDRS